MNTFLRGVVRPAHAIMLSLVALFVLFIGGARVESAAAETPVVRAILFTSPTCPHCQQVKEEVLPKLNERYGEKLQLALVSIATPQGSELFLSACLQFGLTRQSVPLLIVGNAPLLGSEEIPNRFPGLIDKHLAEGGVDWPGIPGLEAMLAARGAPPAASSVAGDQPRRAKVAEEAPMSPASNATAGGSSIAAKAPVATTGAAAAASTVPVEGVRTPPASMTMPAQATAQRSGIIDLTGDAAPDSVADRIMRDLYGNGLAILVLVGMLATIGFSMKTLRRTEFPTGETQRRFDWAIPILVLAGLGVAAYLSTVELRNVEAVCGPVGDCNTVQQSKYAKLFGVLPIGVLGLIGFLGVFASWSLRRWGSDRISRWASVGMLGMTAFGVLFSIYLTFLEPFVIGATCIWCLSSAVIMTTLYVLALKPGRTAWLRLSGVPGSVQPPAHTKARSAGRRR